MNASLAPDHVADLKRSGLTPEIIDTLGIVAVRPHDLKLPGVESAYALPYYTVDGKPSSFQRLKLFPPIKTADGHAQKYFQAPGTPPQLYMPPLFPWGTITKNPKCDLVVCEGEKKAAAVCAKGKFAIGVAGVWNWRQRTDQGERLDLPTFDEFVWLGRSVDVVPDSDAWRADKQKDVLPGFYALAQKLSSLGATVRLVKLSEPQGVKVGLDDWLVAVGGDWEHQWPQLERLALDDARLAPVAAWWQRWREKQVAEESLRAATAEEMELTELAGLYRVRFPHHTVLLQFQRLTERAGGVQAELTATVGHVEVLGETDIGLKSDDRRGKVASTLHRLAGHIPWKPLLERACTSVLKRYRQGEPTILLEPTASSHVPYLLNPLVYSNHQTLIYAPGGSCKSYLALYFALLACHGLAQSGVAGVKCNVLYLDWELNAETVGGRLRALQLGHPELGQIRPYYRRCEVPLHQEVHQVAATVAERKIRLVILDSAAMACGGELSSPDAAIQLQQALRRIGCASLLLAHVAKNVQEGQDRSAYGTVFFRELARNVWELTRAHHSNPVQVVLEHKKDNFSSMRDPLGFAIQFDGDVVRVQSSDVNAQPEFEDKLPLYARIRNLLESDGMPRSAQIVANEVGEKLKVVQATLSRYRGEKWSMIGENRNAQWTVLSR